MNKCDNNKISENIAKKVAKNIIYEHMETDGYWNRVEIANCAKYDPENDLYTVFAGWEFNSPLGRFDMKEKMNSLVGKIASNGYVFDSYEIEPSTKTKPDEAGYIYMVFKKKTTTQNF